MKDRFIHTGAPILVGLTLALFVVRPTIARAGLLRSLAANFLYFDGTQASTTKAPTANASGGGAIYDNTVTTTPAINTLYIAVSATGDLDGQINSLLLACLVDGLPCNSGFGANGAPTGWVMVLNLNSTAQPNSTSDNNINYTWCVPVSAQGSATHTVELRLASGDGTDTVDVEQMHVFVNGGKIGGANSTNACTAGTP